MRPSVEQSEAVLERFHTSFLLIDMSSLDLFPSTLVVLARSMSGLFFACNLASVQNKILAAHAYLALCSNSPSNLNALNLQLPPYEHLLVAFETASVFSVLPKKAQQSC